MLANMQLQVGVKVFLQNKAGRYLLLKRNPEAYPEVQARDQLWDIPGGRIDCGTPLLDNLAREVREETGLTLTSPPHLVTAQDILREDKHVVRLTYHATTDGEPTLDPTEHSEYAWQTKGELALQEGFDRYAKQLLEELPT